MAEGSLLSATWDWIKSGEKTVPEGEIPVNRLTRESFAEPSAEGFTFRWLGHSSVMVELGDSRIMFDPVFTKYASPVPMFVKRFSNSPISVDALPDVDLVVISHDHYDHLDKAVIKALKHQNTRFLVTKGVGKYLMDWGISADRIEELVWWQRTGFKDLEVVCVPARHFSGRGLFNRDETLWAGWVIRCGSRSIYLSGDTGYADHFKVIGDTYGPFDLTMIKIGAYGKDWPDIHVDPEQAVQGHLDAKGGVFLPVHWGVFDLAVHPWDEPITRAVKAAKEKGVKIATPEIGMLVDMERPISNELWWEGIE
jgi:L-ascorbate metabolism protein UlaG (beta-lactamase superfamily)